VPGIRSHQDFDSSRSLPQRFDPGFLKPLAKLESSEIAQWIRARIASGIDPLYVGELVRECVENDWFYIFTDAEFEPMIETRFAEIKKGFDRIRLREMVRAVIEESRKLNQTAMSHQL
jgi:hypothetical protein